MNITKHQRYIHSLLKVYRFMSYDKKSSTLTIYLRNKTYAIPSFNKDSIKDMYYVVQELRKDGYIDGKNK